MKRLLYHDRGDVYGSRERDEIYGSRDEIYGSRDEIYGSRDETYGSREDYSRSQEKRIGKYVDFTLLLSCYSVLM